MSTQLADDVLGSTDGLGEDEDSPNFGLVGGT